MRHAFRSLAAAPIFTCSAVLALALGVGANTAVFSVIHAVLLTPLVFDQPDRLVRVWEAKPAQGIEDGGMSPGTFVDLRQRTQTLERTALLLTPREWLYRAGDELAVLRQATVSPDLFRLLGVRPALGRTFRPERQQAPPHGDSGEVIISDGVWQRLFGGAPGVLGASLTTEGGREVRIVGVMPPGFDFPGRAELWAQETMLVPVGGNWRQVRYYEAVARIRDGVSLEDARSELAAIGAQLALEHPGANAGWELRAESLTERTVAPVRRSLLLLFGAVAAVLLIACANVAALILARASARRHEVAVRVALGARRRDFVQQWLAESAILAAVAGALGLLCAYWLTRVFIAAAPAGIPRLGESGLSLPVLGFGGAVAIVVTLLTGLPPLVLAFRSNAQETLKRTARGSDQRSAWLRSWLVAGEAALTIVLLVSAAMLVRSFVALRGVDLGFTPSSALTAELRVPIDRFPETNRRPWFRLARHYEQLIEGVSALPGVEAAGGITGLPLTSEGSSGNFWKKDADGAEGRRAPASAADQWRVQINIVTPGYFRAMQMPLLSGRGFDHGDRMSEEQLTNPQVPKREGAAVVSEAMAKRFWPGEDPIGRSIVLFDDQSFAASRRIVGIVRDVRSASVAGAPEPAVFLPHAEHPGFRLALVVRTRTAPDLLAGPLRERVRAFDARVYVSRIDTMEAVVSRSLAAPRFNLLLVTTFAAVALLLAAVGIAGVVGYTVSRRTREIGLRVALGATRHDVLRLVLRDGLRPVVAGCAVGTAGALIVAQAMRGLLFGVTPADPVSLAAASALLILTTLVAISFPAARALRVDPLHTLRHD